LQILSTSPRPARALRPALPGGFDAVLTKAMARSRDDRYRNATEFQRDLQALRDRHNAPQLILGDSLRARNEYPGGPALAAAPAEPRRAGSELSSSSVEIPITFSGETPPSGASIPVDDDDIEEYPMHVEVGPLDEARSEDEQATQKRGDEFVGAPAQAR